MFDDDSGTSGNALAFSPDDTLFFADNFFLDTVNPATSASTSSIDLIFFDTGIPVEEFPFPRSNGMDFNTVSGILFASVVDGEGPNAANNQVNFLATINTNTGDVTEIGETVEGLDGIAFCGDEPEPPSGPLVIIPTMGQWGMIFASIILGVFAVIALRRRIKS